MKDRDVLFHEKWLGLAQPIDGLVFSVPVLADAQIAPEIPVELSTLFASHVDTTGAPRIRRGERFFREFLGYDQKGMLVPRSELPAELSFYAAEGGQELRPTFALGRGPFASDDPFAAFEAKAAAPAKPVTDAKPWFALVWDLAEYGDGIDLDAPESATGSWRYSPTAKLERLLRHVGIPVGFLFNGRELRLVYAPSEESPAHLTFRVEHMVRPDGRPLLAALDLLLHARRAYSASGEHTLEGLLAESRRRQADVTDELAKQVFEAVEILVAGFEAAASRDITGARIDWLRAALEEEGDHFYQGILSVVLRLVFLLYAEDQSLLPVEHPIFAEHLSLFGLYARLSHDAGAHPESMHHRFGAYGQLLSLFRTVFFGVKHGSLDVPPRRGRLFDPNAFPFLEGGLPGWTAAVVDPDARAAAFPPSIDDGTVYRVLHRLVVFEGQRLSYRTLDVEQIGSVYESLMGYHVLRLTSPGVRIGKYGVWVESDAVRDMNPSDRARYLKETCGLNPGPAQSLEKSLKEAQDDVAVAEALATQAMGRKGDILRHRGTSGRLVLQPGEERRRTASHYTPRSLTEKVVKRTLEPLLACLGAERTPEQILQLKICDPAMGSGAFLVATCRELAGEIVSAWTRQGVLGRVIDEHGNAHLHARRLVAQKCLYGVDKNAAAVELAKLSLWLVTLSKTLPFTFVDHALRHGDSLVGLDFKQIEAFHWSPPGQVETCRVLLREALDQAVELRQQILELAEHEDAISQGEKRRLFDFSQQSIDRIRLVADACVGAFFAESKDAARDKERQRRLFLVERWLGGAAEAGLEVEALALEARRTLSPFHWWIEFPEVFFERRPDPLQGGTINGAAFMEGVVGNPPYGGKNTLSDAHEDGYIAWLQSLHPGSHGNSDLSAHFFRRAASLLGEHGSFGLIATKTIAQGDTRATGLAPLLRSRWQFYDSTGPMAWPGDAGVTVSIVHGARGNARGHNPIRLNGATVGVLNSRLRPTPERDDPTPLNANANGSFVGTYVLGAGFTLTRERRDALVTKESRNQERIFPYVNGVEVASDPQQAAKRYVISFGKLSLGEAERWPDLIQIVRDEVKPERDKLKNNTDGSHRKKYWWQFGRWTPALYAAIEPLDRCLVTGISWVQRAFTWQPTDRILDQTLVVFPFWQWTQFAILQSRVHGEWSVLLSATFKEDQRYNPSRAFGTFPFPDAAPGTVIPALELTGQALDEARARFMRTTSQGLTKTYNALKNPECTDPLVLELRRLHEAMDRAVLDAYGWKDITVPPYCPLNEVDALAAQSFQDEVIDHLYVLNAVRAREEERLGLAGKNASSCADGSDPESEAELEPPKPTRARKRAASSTTSSKGQGKLFE